MTITTVTYGDNSNRPPETKYETKTYTPEAARAMGNVLGTLNKEICLDCLAKVNFIPGMSIDDTATLV